MLTPPTMWPINRAGPGATPTEGSLKHVTRYGTIMMPQPGNSLETLGTLNPGGAVGPDGAFYLLPRLVAAGNYSRIGLARVTRHPDGRPAGVRRLGIVLAPYKEGEAASPSSSAQDLAHIAEDEGGVEDPRVIYVPLFAQYAMTYTAFSRTEGPRLAMAWSHDLHVWRKTGLVQFAEEESFPGLQHTDNKDAVLLPRPVLGPDGDSCWLLIHRPATHGRPFGMWVSYLPVSAQDLVFRHHRALAWPEQGWEALRIGAGIVTETARGWLLVYHGVEPTKKGRTYHVGAMLLDRHHPERVMARTKDPLFSPRLRIETHGYVSDVCFPTAIQQRAGALDCYYGAADSHIGCARLGLYPTLT